VANNPKIIVQEAEPALPKKTLQITGDELGPQINMNQVKKPTAGPTNRRESVI